MNTKNVLVVLIVIILLICAFGILRNKVKFEKFDGGGHNKINNEEDITKEFIENHGEKSKSLRAFIKNCRDPDKIKMGDDVNDVYTVLYFAVWYKCEELTKFLLKHGAKPYYEKQQGFNKEPFCAAVIIESVRMIKLLIKHIPPKKYNELLNYQNPKYGNTALHIAVNKNQYKLVEELLKREAWMRQNGKGLTPIDIVEKSKDKQMIDLFRKYGHKVILYDELLTAIHKHDIEKVRDSVKNGMSVNEKVDRGISPLHYAIQAYENCRYSNDYVSSVDIIELLINNGADVNEKDDSGMSPLYHAIKVYENISQSGGDINDGDELRFKMIKLLVENGADVNEVRNEKTLLFKVLKDQVSVWLDSGSDNKYRPPVESPLYLHEEIHFISSDKFLDEAYKKLLNHRGGFNIDYRNIINLLINHEAKLFVEDEPNDQELKLLRIYKRYCHDFYYDKFVSHYQHDGYIDKDDIRYIEPELDEMIVL